MTTIELIPTKLGAGRKWYHRLGYAAQRIELTALRITLVYVVFGVVALFLSDVLLVLYLSEPFLSQVQAAKGGAEVLVTAGLVFGLTRQSRRQLRDATERVERQRDELQLLHRVFRHNLRNDLNIIQGNAALTRREVQVDALRDRCERIIETSEKVLEYINQARRIRQITEENTPRRPVDLSAMIHRILDDIPEVGAAVTVTTSIPEEVEVWAHPMLTEALRELVTNAIAHNDADAPALTIDLDPGDGIAPMVELRIEDNGPGIPASELTSLHGDDATQLFHSTGMGLWFVNWVVTHSGGDVSATSGDGRGTAVVLHLPTSPATRAHQPGTATTS